MAIVVPIISEWDPKGLNRAGSDIRRAEGGFAKVGAGFKAAFLPAVGALAGLGAAGLKFAKMASEDAASASKLAKSLSNVTGATDAQVAAVEDWITAQGKALGVSDDELRPALQTLAQASGDVATAQKDAALAMDIAAASGTDTETAAKAIAKAYDGSYGSLKKLVPGIDDAALASKDFGAIMEDTGKIVGGQAADAAATSEGQMKTLQLTLAETQETIGGALLPVLGSMIGLLQKAASWAQDNTGAFIALAAIIGTVAATIVAVNIAMKVYAAASAIVKGATVAWTAVQWLLNASFAPFLLVPLAIIAIGAALVLAYKKVGWFRDAVDGLVKVFKVVFGAIVDAIKAAVGFIKAHWQLLLAILLGPIALAVLGIAKNWDKIKAGAQRVLGWLKTAWQKVTGWLTKPFEVWWSVVSGIIDKIKAAIQTVLDLIGKIKLPSLGDLNPFSRGVEGAVATGVGVSSRAAPSTSASSTTVNVFGAIDPEGTARVVSQLLDQHASRQGRQSNAPRRRAW